MFGKYSAGVEGGKQLLHAEQGVDFPGGEPHAGQRVAFDAAVDAVAAGSTVADDGNAHSVAQIPQIAKHGGARHAEAVLQIGKCNAAARKQQPFDDAETLGLGHVILLLLFVIITASRSWGYSTSGPASGGLAVALPRGCDKNGAGRVIGGFHDSLQEVFAASLRQPGRKA